MKKRKDPTTDILENSFRFCKYTMAILLWLAFIFKSQTLLIIILILFALSALLTVKNAPLIILYTYTINKIFPSKSFEELNIKQMRFVHILGTISSTIALLTIIYSNQIIGWYIVIAFAILQTLGAFGCCIGAGLYTILQEFFDK